MLPGRAVIGQFGTGKTHSSRRASDGQRTDNNRSSQVYAFLMSMVESEVHACYRTPKLSVGAAP